MPHNPDNFYQYNSDVIVCGECLDKDLDATKSGEFVGDERVYSGMYKRLADDDVCPYQCDNCGLQNEAYDNLPELGGEKCRGSQVTS